MREKMIVSNFVGAEKAGKFIPNWTKHFKSKEEALLDGVKRITALGYRNIKVSLFGDDMMINQSEEVNFRKKKKK